MVWVTLNSLCLDWQHYTLDIAAHPPWKSADPFFVAYGSKWAYFFSSVVSSFFYLLKVCYGADRFGLVGYNIILA